MNIQQLTDMATMQREMNSIIHPEWTTQGWDFTTAIIVEAAELIEHIGWKWWKHQEPDMEQAKMELVDIWHFGLSLMIEQGEINDDVVNKMNRLEFIVDTDFNQAIVLAKILVGKLEANDEFDVYIFRQLMYKLGMTTDELYALYVGKNTLNKFRQANGYKQGTYVKVWNGEEDNVHLMRMLKTIPANATLQVNLMEALTEAYMARG